MTDVAETILSETGNGPELSSLASARADALVKPESWAAPLKLRAKIKGAETMTPSTSLARSSCKCDAAMPRCD